jgi:hypothetical protein
MSIYSSPTLKVRKQNRPQPKGQDNITKKKKKKKNTNTNIKKLKSSKVFFQNTATPTVNEAEKGGRKL